MSKKRKRQTEIEAKFSVPGQTTLERLRQVRQLAGFTVGEWATHRVTDHYLDTADRRLLTAGLACRVRESEQSPLLTIKSRGTISRNIRQRAEYEVWLDPAQTFLSPSLWPDSDAKHQVIEVVGDEPLETLFFVSQDRHTCQLMDGTRPVAELSLDRVRLEDDTLLSELEIELLTGGSLDDLQHISQAVSSEWDLIPVALSKFEQGLGCLIRWDGFEHSPLTPEKETRLIEAMSTSSPHETAGARSILLLNAGIDPPSVAALVGVSQSQVAEWMGAYRSDPTPLQVPQRLESIIPRRRHADLKADDPMSEAGRKTLRLHFARMLSHEPGTRAGLDIEELHDMRVATRRMRAAFRVFGPYFKPETVRPFLKGLKRTGRALGPVRDLDVFEEKAQHYLASLPGQERDGEIDHPRPAPLSALLDDWHRDRREARERMLAYLNGPEYERFVQLFDPFLCTPRAGSRLVPAGEPTPYQVRHVAPRLIYSRYEEVRAFEVLLSSTSISLLHSLRIQFKQFRYALEFFLPVLGPEAASVIAESKQMQDHLGDLNDADVAVGLLEEYIEEKPDPGVSAYLHHRLAERDRLVSTFPDAWARFNQTNVRRQLALAVAAL